MSSNFPESLDLLTNPNSTDSLSSPSHSQQHINANDAIEALETKVGINNSEDPSSLDYLIRSAASQSQNMGIGGNNANNDLPAIENPTFLRISKFCAST